MNRFPVHRHNQQAYFARLTLAFDPKKKHVQKPRCLHAPLHRRVIPRLLGLSVLKHLMWPAGVAVITMVSRMLTSLCPTE